MLTSLKAVSQNIQASISKPILQFLAQPIPEDEFQSINSIDIFFQSNTNSYFLVHYRLGPISFDPFRGAEHVQIAGLFGYGCKNAMSEERRAECGVLDNG
jgi:hypothetical protein